jgi:adenosylcobinamide-phosphate synthase
MSTVLAMWVAVWVDAWLGEPRGTHPLVLFGQLAGAIEKRLHADKRIAGVLSWSLAVLPLVLMLWLVQRFLPAWSSWCVSVLTLYLAIGLRSLGEHAKPVADALTNDQLDDARRAVGRMVSRDTGALNTQQVSAAATESVLENGNDAVFGALFWFAVLGAPGALLYRLANTLDAMWGYRTSRYENFGWAAARIDDVLNFVPARLTAFTYALCGRFDAALRCWRKQAPQWDSPNAGPVMAAGAGALGMSLGGAAPYHGVWEVRPELGEGDLPDATAIYRALALVRRGVALWLLAALLFAASMYGGAHA